MENASKALLIAAAILIAIVLITLGLVAINNSRTTITQSSDMSAQEVQTFNQTFTNYTGTSTSGKTISANDLNNLMEKIQSSNLAENQKESGRYVGMTGTILSSAGSTVSVSLGSTNEGEYSPISNIPTASNSKRYTVIPTFSTTTGLIYKITVSVAGASSGT